MWSLIIDDLQWTIKRKSVIELFSASRCPVGNEESFKYSAGNFSSMGTNWLKWPIGECDESTEHSTSFLTHQTNLSSNVSIPQNLYIMGHRKYRIFSLRFSTKGDREKENKSLKNVSIYRIKNISFQNIHIHFVEWHILL